MGTAPSNRRCPRRGGNLFLYHDHEGWYEQCLQCSSIVHLDMVRGRDRAHGGPMRSPGDQAACGVRAMDYQSVEVRS